MARQTSAAIAAPATRVDIRPGQGLIAVTWLDGDERVVSCFNDEAAARAFMASQPGETAMTVLGDVSDPDRNGVEQELDRIRRSSPGQDGSRRGPEGRDSAVSLVARSAESLIAIPDEVGGEPVLRFFVDGKAARAFAEERTAAGRPFGWIGAWADLDWDEFVEWLDRIRHESKPTPPIDDLGL